MYPLMPRYRTADSTNHPKCKYWNENGACTDDYAASYLEFIGGAPKKLTTIFNLADADLTFRVRAVAMDATGTSVQHTGHAPYVAYGLG